MTNQLFDLYYPRSARQLEDVVKGNASESQLSYYLIVNSWEKVCNVFEDTVAARFSPDSEVPLSIIDIMDVPNCLEVMRSAIRESKETINTSALNNYHPLPMLVVMHKAFPRMVSHTCSISTELGL